MTLIVVAMSRVSMRIVNDALDARRAGPDPDAPEYRARPPRRKALHRRRPRPSARVLAPWRSASSLAW